MCGVIGVELAKITRVQLEKVNHLIQESAIRGIHATGISFLQQGKITTIKSHLPAEKFVLERSLGHFRESNGTLSLIAHTRYSTSDLKYNQPIGDSELAICHNGVISQADPTLWPQKFGLQPNTTNDSELILKCIQKGLDHPLVKFKGSMAVCVLTPDGVFAFRNHERPLWFSQEENGVVFASTKDILYRSGFEDPQKCEMFNVYYVGRGGDVIRKPYPIPDGVTDLQ